MVGYRTGAPVVYGHVDLRACPDGTPRHHRAAEQLRLLRRLLSRLPGDAVARLRVCFRRADSTRTSRGDAAAATWIYSADESRRRRGRDVDIFRGRVAAAANAKTCRRVAWRASDESRLAVPPAASIRRQNVARRYDKRSGAALCRASQPRAGLTGTAATPEDDAALLHVRAACARSSTRADAFDEVGGGASGDDDEVLFSRDDARDDEIVLEVSATEPATTHRPRRAPVLRICDCRPVLNAKANAAMGKGHEVTSRLGGDGCATLEFFDVANIHAMRKSFDACAEACRRSDDDFLVDVHASRWPHHLGAVLRGAAVVARHLEAGDPVLVHCSDGWDRTAQVCALAQLLLDPYFRTTDGFRTLIDKDFCAFGYMFRERAGLGEGPPRGNQPPRIWPKCRQDVQKHARFKLRLTAPRGFWFPRRRGPGPRVGAHLPAVSRCGGAAVVSKPDGVRVHRRAAGSLAGRGRFAFLWRFFEG